MDVTNLASLTKVVVVDNVRTQGLAIQDALGQSGVASYFHFFEDKTKIKEVSQFPNVRLIFLDLELDSTSRDVKIKAGIAFSCLRRIVKPSSYYVLVVWSGELNTPLSKRFLSILKTEGKDIYPCVKPILLNKKDFTDRRYPTQDRYRAALLRDEINRKLKAVDFFKLFSDWERQINSVTSEFLRELLGTENRDSVSRKINSLADAYAGQHAEDNPSLYALLTLNSSFRGALDSAVSSSINYKPSNAAIIDKVMVTDIKEKARINSLLMLNEHISIGPGCVYLNDKKYTKDLYDKVSKELLTKRNIKHVKVDITPVCDFAQPNKTVVHTYVHGLIIPVANMKKDRRSGLPKKLINNMPRYYELNRYFTVKGRQWNLIIDLAAIETLPAGKTYGWPKIEDVLFKLRDNIVIDFQHASSSHNSRPGHTLLS